jgi:hypothetical protein
MPDPNTEHGLRVQLATALRERDTYRDDAAYFKASYQRKLADEKRLLESAAATVAERDALRTALTDIVTLCMDVPATEDWRAKVGDKARKALYGEPGWKQT